MYLFQKMFQKKVFQKIFHSFQKLYILKPLFSNHVTHVFLSMLWVIINHALNSFTIQEKGMRSIFKKKNKIKKLLTQEKSLFIF